MESRRFKSIRNEEIREANFVKREGFNKENRPARSAHKGPIATLVLRLAMNATARACAEERGLPRRALVSPLRSVASLGLAFTMAEILLSLTIIGVVAAITLPSLTGNINERTWETQRKALFSRMTQAVALMPALNGYGTFNETTDNAAETFITSGLSKVLKINNICNHDHLADCGLPSKVTRADGTVAFTTFPQDMGEFNTSWGGYPKPKVAAFETANGESVALYYNPRCISNNFAMANVQIFMCANMVYDLNGKKGPNTFGKDIGYMSVMYATDAKVLSVVPVNNDSSTAYKSRATEAGEIDAARACTEMDKDYRLPNIDELSTIFYNKDLLNFNCTNDVWSSSVISNDQAWEFSAPSGIRYMDRRWDVGRVRCIKRQ